MRKVIIICIASLALGVISPFIVNTMGLRSASSGLLHTWFMLLPSVVDQWLWPDGAMAMLALATLVLTFQYLTLFAMCAAIWPLSKVALDFVRPPRHRQGLGARRG